jgi:hypothetical protein
MKTFILKTKTGENISKVDTYDIDMAYELFSIRKNLSTIVLLDIYDVVEEPKIKSKKITFS